MLPEPLQISWRLTAFGSLSFVVTAGSSVSSVISHWILDVILIGKELFPGRQTLSSLVSKSVVVSFHFAVPVAALAEPDRNKNMSSVIFIRKKYRVDELLTRQITEKSYTI